ncbi:Lytic transglycosylase catalytic [Paludibacter propionicigenes WB4]|uniref:Lytic transglycosylase catalytic n=1 Tax=Paludibacter propionicigenes (strain DSM 17365 / JCM 13257 / WB4) TaxID=694427 RepID=E4T4F1_PALPW|nr:lytic transglycosylase domain-containing protein [Paludibacter propionicigenes]ADQ79595.1 Lytic transglycosylase catalytic [Paludibacter propionicigenes WB4]
MRFQILFSTVLLFLISSTCVHSQVKSNAHKDKSANELVFDSTLTVPLEFDNTLDYMLQSWVIQRASTLNCNSSDNVVAVPDSVYKLRLSKMPCLMEMPYNPNVRSFIELYTVRKRHQVEYMLGMSNYYFPLFEQVLGANNLPLELKYLSIIESALNTTIVSRMGAAGLWQLMIGTGRMYGLEINSLVDERLSPVKATNAAAKFLKDLYAIYGDWNLVIASYNCGPGNINKAIRRAGGKRDYWAIYPYLPRETRGYVPIFIAANYSLHYASQHNLCPAIVNMPTLTDTVMVHQRIHLEQVANVLNLPIDEVRLLNPQYKKDIIPGDIKPYALCLPLNSINAFIAKFNEVVSYKADELINNRRGEIEIIQAAATITPGGSGRVTYHKVKSGQTLSDVADKYGVSLKKLKKWNNIKGSKIVIGQKLKIIK